ncbi:type II secretion system major pseudopilin GspG, partial [Bdellovibrionota bacterium]
NKNLQKGKVMGGKAQIKLLEQSLADFYRDNDFFPTTEQGLQALVEKSSVGREAKNWSGPYVSKGKIPLDPWSNEYQYFCDDGQKYIIISLGRDGQEGGTDFDADISTESE